MQFPENLPQFRRIQPICTLAIAGKFLFIFLAISAKHRFTSRIKRAKVFLLKRRRQRRRKMHYLQIELTILTVVFLSLGFIINYIGR
jgi:hypothetical protein